MVYAGLLMILFVATLGNQRVSIDQVRHAELMWELYNFDAFVNGNIDKSGSAKKFL